MEFFGSIRRLPKIFRLQSHCLELFMLYEQALISPQFMLLQEVSGDYGEYSSHGVWCII
jgi:hypothetical protein